LLSSGVIMIIERTDLRDIEKEILLTINKVHCSYCFVEIKGEVEFTVHRDGFGIGPEVPLCVGCGSKPIPTLEEIWSKIARR
jgi:hypothetical protein